MYPSCNFRYSEFSHYTLNYFSFPFSLYLHYLDAKSRLQSYHFLSIFKIVYLKDNNYKEKRINKVNPPKKVNNSLISNI